MKSTIQLEPEAQAFAEVVANPPFLFDLGPEKGRAVFDIRSISQNTGIYQVKFELPCGKKEVLVKVR